MRGVIHFNRRAVMQVPVNPQLAVLRQRVAAHYLADEAVIVRRCIDNAALSGALRTAIASDAAALIHAVRKHAKPSIMEAFLAEYQLSTKEGLALMCMAEALLRVPDDVSVTALIEDKVAAGDWQSHLGHSASRLMNTASWGLLVAAKLFRADDVGGLLETLRRLTQRLSGPVVRNVALQVMRQMGRQFVLGRNIVEAQRHAALWQAKGYGYSYDMLGEAARTGADAERYLQAYGSALAAIGATAKSDDIRLNPGISVKLSALNCRYQWSQREQVLADLVPKLLTLCLQAKVFKVGLNIDAEESDRLELSLDIIEAVLSAPELAGWDGFGVVVQAYGQRASFVLDWLYGLAVQCDRRIMVRLVKGAYWDSEIKRAQVLGLAGFPVFTRKASTDVAYIACAKQLLDMTDRIYPQFATHNAHSVAAILKMAEDHTVFEFQRLHGMGESLFKLVMARHAVRCRIYAPVGAHSDLLAYLVRRLLENGANSSFVNKMADPAIAPEDIARDPFSLVESVKCIGSTSISQPRAIFGGQRRNALGFDVTDRMQWRSLEPAMKAFKASHWQASPRLGISTDVESRHMQAGTPVINPADTHDIVGHVVEAHDWEVDAAIDAAEAGFVAWSSLTPAVRSERLFRVADMFERHAPELIALAIREAGKTVTDAIGELREAVDFARFYAVEASRVNGSGRGIVTCISPWNFPLAIFSGQILANLAAANVVIAKPAPQTPLIAARAVTLMHAAGVPRAAVQLLPGNGEDIGARLVASERMNGVCFTGSTTTAQLINRVMADCAPPDAALIAETGGLNAMIVDSTALPEQVVAQVLESAFQSAGQRCSALRILYLQADIAERILTMLAGAMDALVIGDPWLLSTDVGPVIDEQAQRKINDYIEAKFLAGQVIKRLRTPSANACSGFFVAPTVIRVPGIEALETEIFGPVLHVATFEAAQLDAVIDAINAKGFGLTFGMHSRIDERINRVCERIRVGNIYINRNQIGAVVGSQPFGGEGLSGTGPKAGGFHYVPRLQSSSALLAGHASQAATVDAPTLQRALDDVVALAVARGGVRRGQIADANLGPLAQLDDEPVYLPGPTGELNRLSYQARGVILCLGPTLELLREQCAAALSQGNRVVVVSPLAPRISADLLGAGLPAVFVEGVLSAPALIAVAGLDAVANGGGVVQHRAYRAALARRQGAIVPLISDASELPRFVIERHLCVDTTAAGGNASLIASAE